jgi:hypothetical protein
MLLLLLLLLLPQRRQLLECPYGVRNAQSMQVA